MKRAISIVVLLLCTAFGVFAQEGRLQFASLGDLKLAGGGVIQDCRVGYRTFGKLTPDRSNVVVMPTWFTGTTEQLQPLVGPGQFADSSRYYVILIDSLGNGVSSSPSNSQLQPRGKFPPISIRDMVNSQHELLARILHIHHVKAITGISMGGMQTFQWMVSYPDFLDKAVAIVGSPRLTAYDLLLWQTEIDVIKNDPAWNNGNYLENPARSLRAELGALTLTTPERFNQQTTRPQALALSEDAKKGPGFDANDQMQAQAMMSLDVSEAFGGSMERAAGAVKAKVLIVSAMRDHTVSPSPALEFARLVNATVLRFDNDCGHLLFACEKDRLTAEVRSFLEN
jgi:homoserine O-acetyltransferase